MDKPHPTRRKLIETVLELAEDADFDQITIDMVLDASSVSKGSLYYHFTDFPDLVSTAMAHLFSIGVDRSIQQMDGILRGCQTRGDFLDGLRLAIVYTLGEDGVRQRLNRARIIGMTARNLKLRQHISREQARMTRSIEALFSDARRQGWLNDEFDTHAGAVFVQAYTLGKIVDDVSDDQIDQQKWIDLIMMTLQRVFMA